MLFPRWLHHFTFLPTVHEGSSLFTSFPTLVVSCIFFFNSSHASECEVVSHCGFDLHLPKDQRC